MVSAAAKHFLDHYVDSAESLDILMVLWNRPDEAWTCDTLSARIFTVPQAAQKRLDQLVQRGVAEQRSDLPGAYQIRSSLKRDVRAGLEALAAAYSENRAEVVGVVLSRANDPLSSFANAFKFRSDS